MPAVNHKSIRGYSIAALIIGSMAGAAGLTYAGFAWSQDQLITPHGWIVVACTTTCALGIFLGTVGMQRVRDREIQDKVINAAAQIDSIRTMIEPLGNLAAQVEDLRLQITGLDNRNGSQTRIMRRLVERVGIIERTVRDNGRTVVELQRFLDAVASYKPEHNQGGDEPETRTEAWLADMAESVRLGRELERRKRRDIPPEPR